MIAKTLRCAVCNVKPSCWDCVSPARLRHPLCPGSPKCPPLRPPSVFSLFLVLDEGTEFTAVTPNQVQPANYVAWLEATLGKNAGDVTAAEVSDVAVAVSYLIFTACYCCAVSAVPIHNAIQRHTGQPVVGHHSYRRRFLGECLNCSTGSSVLFLCL